MGIVDILVSMAHMVFAGVWTGSVVFVSLGVVPFASTGEMDGAVFGEMIDRTRGSLA